MPKFNLHKLVRNGIVSDQKSLGQIPSYKKLIPEEHINALIAKIIEETRELDKSTPTDRPKELADIQQAVDDLALLYGVSKENIARVQQEKANRMGTFFDGTYISVLQTREDNPWTKYYRQDPARYPEE